MFRDPIMPLRSATRAATPPKSTPKTTPRKKKAPKRRKNANGREGPDERDEHDETGETELTATVGERLIQERMHAVRSARMRMEIVRMHPEMRGAAYLFGEPEPTAELTATVGERLIQERMHAVRSARMDMEIARMHPEMRVSGVLTGQPRPGGGSADSPRSASFVAAAAFEGARPGYAFKRGASGLGYYGDKGGARHPSFAEGADGGEGMRSVPPSPPPQAAAGAAAPPAGQVRMLERLATHASALGVDALNAAAATEESPLRAALARERAAGGARHPAALTLLLELGALLETEAQFAEAATLLHEACEVTAPWPLGGGNAPSPLCHVLVSASHWGGATRHRPCAMC